MPSFLDKQIPSPSVSSSPAPGVFNFNFVSVEDRSLASWPEESGLTRERSPLCGPGASPGSPLGFTLHGKFKKLCGSRLPSFAGNLSPCPTTPSTFLFPDSILASCSSPTALPFLDSTSPRPVVPALASIPSPRLNSAFGLLSPRGLSPNAPLVGDFTRPHLLPVLDPQAEVKKVTGAALRGGLLGIFQQTTDDMVPEIVIVDCRYPYEYDGGHIKGAINLFSDQDVVGELFNKNTSLHSKNRSVRRPVLVVFHCEFSVKRSLDRLRHFRKHDRLQNIETYPGLCFPEVYLLAEGYCGFFSAFPELCTPQGYVTMKDEAHQQAFVRFSRGKTFDGGLPKGEKRFRRHATTLR